MSLLLRGLVRTVPPLLLWRIAAREVGIPGVRATNCWHTPLGWGVAVRLQPPYTQAALTAQADALATAFGVARVRVIADESRADRAVLALDLVTSLGSLAYPADTDVVRMPHSAGLPVRLGRDDDGAEVRLTLHGSSLLVGGNPGSGKSTAVRTLLAGLAQQRHTALVGIDPKRVELAPWRDRFTHLVVGNEAEPTIALLRALVDEVQRRAELLSERGLLFAVPDADMPAVVLVVDEWAELAADGTSKQRSEAQDLLRRFVSLGRAVGCSAVLATQRPTSDTVDTGTRALLAHRLALRCGDRWQSEAILGQGQDGAARIPLTCRGRGLLASDHGVNPVQVYELSPDLIWEKVCPVLRVPLPHLTG
jgi:hypothetical protein